MRILLPILCILSACTQFSCNRSGKEITQRQTEQVWTILGEHEIPPAFIALGENARPGVYQMYVLELGLLQEQLDAVPNRDDVQAKDSDSELSFPIPEGELAGFKMVSTLIMEQELADKFPDLKTYEGVSTAAAHTTIRVSRNKMGIDAMILSPDGTMYIDPVKLDDQVYYVVYHKADFISDTRDRFFEPPRK